MNKSLRSSKGFTLVEIMIVVVIIGLLAAMAIPAFQKVRRDSIKKTIVNDARLLGAAAQQYFMDKAVTTVGTAILVGTNESNYVKAFSKGNSCAAADITSANTFTFTMANALVGTSALTFDNEGHLTAAGDPY